MTREEALNVIWMRCQHNDETYEAYCVLKHEQQPCDDATLGECLGLKMSLKIIDKYKAEGSNQE